MGKFSKKHTTKGEAAPAAVKLLKKVKREPEDDLETKPILKRQKKDVTETLMGRRIETKVDLLATKADLLISAKGKRVLAKKPVKAKAESSSSEDDSSSSDDEYLLLASRFTSPK